MSDYGTTPTGFNKPKGRKNKHKKRNSGTAGRTILGIGAALGTAYAANQAYQGYQASQQPQGPRVLWNESAIKGQDPGITSVPNRPYGGAPREPVNTVIKW